jgi:hypothetical protein
MVFNRRRRPILKLDASGKSRPMSIIGEISPPAERSRVFSFGGFDRRWFSTVAAARF